MRKRHSIILTAYAAVSFAAGDAVAQSSKEKRDAVERGRTIVAAKCAGCHATTSSGASALAAALPFRDLHAKYDVSALAEALAEGIVTGHEAMPEFRFKPRDVTAIIAYLRTLRP